MEQNKKILISGASFAGLSTAYWMNKMGYKVTIVEIGSQLKTGGTPVDITGNTVEIVKKMGLFEQIKNNRLNLEKWEFKDAEDNTGYSFFLDQTDEEFEIERDILLKMLHNTIKNDVEFIFNNSITEIDEIDDSVIVTFKDGLKDQYELLFGCDGIHSGVRKIWFGDESKYSHFLGQYFSIAIVDKYLIKDSTLQLYTEPNKAIMLNTYNNKTDVVFTFRPEKEISYDFRNQSQIKEIVSSQMNGISWRANELQKELLNSTSFYFDKFCQVKMTSWTKGRVALVGDSGYCASPAAGMGGSLAIIGAAALADAFEKNNGDYELAFQSYNKDLRPFIEKVQTSAVEMLGKLLPHTAEEVNSLWKNGIEDVGN